MRRSALWDFYVGFGYLWGSVMVTIACGFLLHMAALVMPLWAPIAVGRMFRLGGGFGLHFFALFDFVVRPAEAFYDHAKKQRQLAA